MVPYTQAVRFFLLGVERSDRTLLIAVKDCDVTVHIVRVIVVGFMTHSGFRASAPGSVVLGGENRQRVA